MTEFQVGGKTFRADRLPPKKAWHIVRRLAPVFGGLREALPTLLTLIKPGGIADRDDETVFDDAARVFEPIAVALARMPEEDCDYVMDACLGVVQIQLEGGTGWASIQVGNRLMYEWITMPLMVQLVWNVLQQNLTDFFPAGAPA